MSLGFAKKVGMTRLFVDGKAVPVTALEFQPGYVLQTKTKEKDGYQAIQIGSVKRKKATKAALGHIKAALPEAEYGFRFISEFPAIADSEKKEFSIEDFAENDLLNLTGTVIGRGYTGAMKRWGFHGQPQTHGHDHVRAVGSMGSRWPQRVTKGKKMAGHYGDTALTLRNVRVLAIDKELGLLFVNGSVPGSNSSFVKLSKVSK
jgi:large subunit ribosomal protein L3